ncbi:hypothetical protein JCM17845_02430 [Iodidimonas gelatinilytica]|uniref:Uncharacterized protein n=1 Tax=Iodidimonas gelatinilytica TaxID=1236966 RepID=A0A5A7MXF9_9PROT|nr:Gldg family protein [Iodidimonas gelatinilytica]GEQ99619.1 hypothetical protein JCM17845_02430 [Iodidimonas gelatinilytica]
MTSRRLSYVTAALLAVILFGAITVILPRGLAGARLDLTQDKLYSISPSTERVLGDLDDPITVTYFFSQSVARDYPQIFTYGRRIRDLLAEYEALSDGKIRLEVIEPEPFSESEDSAVAAGLQGVPTNSGEQIYMGLVARDLTDRMALVPFFNQDRATFLEYDLTKLIASIAQPDKPALTLLTSLPMIPGQFGGFGAPARPGWAIHEQLTQLFDLGTLDADFTHIPQPTDILLIVHPPELSPRQLYAIDQFVLAGGRAVIFVDPLSEAVANARLPSAAPESSSLDPLFGAWGVDLIDDRVVADVDLAQRVNMGDGGPRAIKDFALWLAARAENTATDDPVTANLEQINLASSGALLPIEGSSVHFEPLLQSSAVSALLDKGVARGMPDPDHIMRMIEPTGERYTLIARLNGDGISAFPDGPPPPEDNGEAETDRPAEDEPPHLARSKGPINVIVGADSDLFDDRFWVQVQDFFGERIHVPVADNANLVINAIDQLSGSDALIALRGRGVTQRPFDRVEDIRRAAESRFRMEEERLQAELAQTEARLADLQTAPLEGELMFSSEQDVKIQRFRDHMLEIRKELRTVQRNLIEDITALGARLALLNIALMPALLIVAALGLAIWRRKRSEWARQLQRSAP